FVDRKLAVLQSGSWLPGAFPRQQWPTFGQRIGFIPMFPVPSRVNQTIPYYNKTISMILTVALDPMYQNTHKELII
ncbi:MAG TPA: hypothetical protein VK553_02805, partial [Candidatus Nitrosopolaris rasttigaisensis]|nr:hypothetical protein [Candidatus Nitrosopolaris rasttigaisensis]